MKLSLCYFYLLVLVTLLVPSAGKAQSFGVQDTIKYLVKDISASTPPHDNIQLINNTNDTLYLRWVETRLPGFSTAWDLGLQDPDNYYYPQILDSADFYIESPASSVDKMIINLYHNNNPGNGRVKYKIYDIANPSDSLNIYFDFTITAQGQGNGINESFAKYFSYTVGDGKLYLHGQNKQILENVKLYSIDGKLITNKSSMSTMTVLNLPYSKAIYVVVVTLSEGTFSFKINT